MLARFDLVSLVGVADMDRARRFYGDVLGLPVVAESPFAVAARLAVRPCRRTTSGPEPSSS